ncbi:MAG TPA: RluA family pseudouridine synthase [Candidatus Sabulitectum sp.]|nr:RluA family pseudouridine synthase [Candidatus Sabulitectum sp.]HPF31837.1 RluA family pseudouridine synthase [Candidatus Sabulitectum sp.]HPJ28730.1 RluA family pseudouridine synthase [Candidatus Sabulitectum sp.]HPR22395.1 RluA family pseudouridine synthase [Candidatus Sabulitectum sp.]
MGIPEYQVEEDESGIRLDSFLALQDDLGLSRSYISALVRNGHVSVDGSFPEKPSTRLRNGQIVAVRVPDPEPIDLVPENIPLDIVYEDRHLIVVDKHAGLVVHPTASTRNGTLVNALLFHCRGSLSGISGELRPGIVHRLDKDTTGLMMAAKSDETHRHLAAQLAAHTVKRRYVALCWGIPSPKEGRIEAPIGRDPRNRQKMAVVQGGRRAVTNYRVIAPYGFSSLIECRLETGRTHQIRVHMSSVKKCSIIADGKYGGCSPKGYPSTRENRELVSDAVRMATHQMLHAETLGFVHPVTGEELEFHSAPPIEFRLVQKKLASHYEGTDP